jgi:hypothetical protein
MEFYTVAVRYYKLEVTRKQNFTVLIFISFFYAAGCSQADCSDSTLILNFSVVENGMLKGCIQLFGFFGFNSKKSCLFFL